MTAGTVYMRHITGDSSYVEEHHCWDAERFIAARKEECDQINNKNPKKPPKMLMAVEVITQAQYRAIRFTNKGTKHGKDRNETEH